MGGALGGFVLGGVLDTSIGDSVPAIVPPLAIAVATGGGLFYAASQDGEEYSGKPK